MHVLPVLAFFALSQPIWSWSYVGHELIASIASDFLTPHAASHVSRILDAKSLSSIAAWADSVRWQSRYAWSSKMHYISSPDPPCSVSYQQNETFNVISAIHNYTARLNDARYVDTWAESESLRFLVHFTQDLHQPLHLTGRARGGNDISVVFDGRKANLHQVWDGLGLLKRIKSVSESGQPYREYILDLMASPAYSKRVQLTWLLCPHTSLNPEFGCPEYWAQDVAPINCEYVWPNVTHGQILDQAYWDRVERGFVFEELIMKAAVRLAAVLNAVFESRELTTG